MQVDRFGEAGGFVQAIAGRVQRRGARLSTTLAATLLAARARALQIRNEHESARTACTPLSVLKLIRYVNAFVDRCRPS